MGGVVDGEVIHKAEKHRLFFHITGFDLDRFPHLDQIQQAVLPLGALVVVLGLHRKAAAARLLPGIDIHRDGIPDQSEYTCTIDGENASQVRLLVGKSNQNSSVNREFAKQIKAVADKKYPGLIKDIFIGKGNYNQDLSPNAILLEFGTHTISKERVLNSTDLMAQVVSTALYGPQTGSAKAEGTSESSSSASQKESEKGVMGGLTWMIVLVVLGVVVFALAQTGSGKAMVNKIGRGMREMTGGMVGKKPEKDN